jgi:hypothetical protein
MRIAALAHMVDNHNRRQIHTTAAVDGYPLSGRSFALIDDRAKGGYKPTTEIALSLRWWEAPEVKVPVFGKT